MPLCAGANFNSTSLLSTVHTYGRSEDPEGTQNDKTPWLLMFPTEGGHGISGC